MYKKILALTIISLVVYWAAVTIPTWEAHAQPIAKAKPVAQVYEVQGSAEVKRHADGKSLVLEKGLLLASDDLLTLKKGALVGLYFKDGGNKHLKEREKSATYKVADLSPRTAAYERETLAFGGTRGLNITPQKTLVVSSAPLIELLILNESGKTIQIPHAKLQILQNDRVVHSKDWNNLKPEISYEFPCNQLVSDKEYGMEVELDVLDKIITFASKFYIVGAPDKDSMFGYEPFYDTEYKSLDSTSTDYKGKIYNFRVTEYLKFQKGKNQPLISVEVLVK